MTSLREAEFETDFGGLEQILRRYESQPWAKLANGRLRRQDRARTFRLVSYAATSVLVWARNDRVANVGRLWPELSPARVDGSRLAQRRRRACPGTSCASSSDESLGPDERPGPGRGFLAATGRDRQALLGVLNVQYHLDSTTPPGGTNPLAFSSAATNQQLIINGQPCRSCALPSGTPTGPPSSTTSGPGAPDEPGRQYRRPGKI